MIVCAKGQKFIRGSPDDAKTLQKWYGIDAGLFYNISDDEEDRIANMVSNELI